MGGKRYPTLAEANDIYNTLEMGASGLVLSSKMDKTVVVEVARKFPHPTYRKYVNRSKKYYAHDPQNLCELGDTVLIEEFRPISKLKRWKVITIKEKAIK